MPAQKSRNGRQVLASCKTSHSQVPTQNSLGPGLWSQRVFSANLSSETYFSFVSLIKILGIKFFIQNMEIAWRVQVLVFVTSEGRRLVQVSKEEEFSILSDYAQALVCFLSFRDHSFLLPILSFCHCFQWEGKFGSCYSILAKSESL